MTNRENQALQTKASAAVIARSAYDEAIHYRGRWIASLSLAMTG
jgi:hypothetical protein